MRKKAERRIHPPYNRFKGVLREKGITYADLAEILCLTPTTVSAKINGISDFYISEMNVIESEYGIDRQFFSS